MNRKERNKQLIKVLPKWYEENKRDLPWRKDNDPYHVWVSEIMLQQTRIETVIPYYERFLKEIPDIESLAKIPEERLQKLWEGLGYYSRVRNLQTAAKQIMEEYDGVFPDDYEKIRKLKGIGDYTAGAIASICFQIPAPAVDGNVLRVLSRIHKDDRPVNDEKTKKEISQELWKIYPKETAGSFTQGIMELGETVCLPGGTPNCDNCPCNDFCLCNKGDWAGYPKKEEKKERKKQQFTVFLLRCGDKIAIRKREESGLLSGLWEYPNVPGYLNEEDALRQIREWGLSIDTCREEKEKKHIFTHIEWDMKCYSAYCDNMSDLFLWVSERQLEEVYSLPTAFRKLFKGV